MGSGHVLVYAFNVFMQLYVNEGYRERDAAELIISNNLYGLEIDKRAYQLAYFALMMKGRQYNRTILTKDIQTNIYQFVDSKGISKEYFEYLKEVIDLNDNQKLSTINLLKDLLREFENASEIGSIIKLDKFNLYDVQTLKHTLSQDDEFSNMDILYQIPEMHYNVLQILEIALTMLNKYVAVVTNPPYLNKMSLTLEKYAKSNYSDVKTDLFSIFIEGNTKMTIKNGYASFMTPFVWMFIKSYDSLRSYLINNQSITSLVQMEYSAFEEATVPVCCFTIKNSRIEPVGNYFKLSEFRGGMEVQKAKVKEALANNKVSYLYKKNQNYFNEIPGSPISYWASDTTYKIFANKTIEEFGEIKSGIMVNNKFKHDWYEVMAKNIQFSARSLSDMKGYRWFPLNSGQGYKKWYGNNGIIVDLEKDAIRVKNSKTNYRLRDQKYYFKTGITWGRITSSEISFRKSRQGNLFGDAGPMMFIDENYLNLILGLANSKVILYISSILNPTLNFQIHDFKRIPIPNINEQKKQYINDIVNSCVEISKADSNSLELSWDFDCHPLI